MVPNVDLPELAHMLESFAQSAGILLSEPSFIKLRVTQAYMFG